MPSNRPELLQPNMLATIPSPPPLPSPLNKRYPAVHHVIAPPRRPRRYPRLITFDNNGELQPNPVKSALKLGATSTKYSLPPLSSAIPIANTSTNASTYHSAPVSHRHPPVAPPQLPPPASARKPFPLSSAAPSAPTPRTAASHPPHASTAPYTAPSLPHPSTVTQPYTPSLSNMPPPSQPTSAPAQYASTPYTSTPSSSAPYVSASYAPPPNASTSTPLSAYPSYYSPPPLSSPTASTLPPPPRRLPVEQRSSGPPSLRKPPQPEPMSADERRYQPTYWNHQAAPENHTAQIYTASPQSTIAPGTPSISAPSTHSVSPYTSSPYTTLRSAHPHPRTAETNQATHYSQSGAQVSCSISEKPPTRPLRSDERVQISNLTTQQPSPTMHAAYRERTVNGYGVSTATNGTSLPVYQPRPVEPMHSPFAAQRDGAMYRSGASTMNEGTAAAYWHGSRTEVDQRGSGTHRPSHNEFRRVRLVRDTELQRVQTIARNKMKVKMNLRGRTKIEHWLLKGDVVSKAIALLVRAFGLDSMVLSSSAPARKACLEKMKNDDLRLMEALMIRLGNKNGYESWELLTERFTPDSFC